MDDIRHLGPYTGEIGWEILYWVPYLRWRLKGDFTDCVAISRGDCSLWYDCPIIDYAEVVKDYNKLLDYRWRSRKTYRPLFDDDRLEQAIFKELGVTSSIRVAEMFELLRHPKKRGVIKEHLTKIECERYPGLPDRYVAVKFIAGGEWMQTPPKIDVNLPVVVIRQDADLGGHTDLDFQGDITIVDKSLNTLTRIVAHADKFYCTYGGLAWLGIRCCTPTEAFYQNLGKRCPHIENLIEFADHLGAEYARTHY